MDKTEYLDWLKYKIQDEVFDYFFTDYISASTLETEMAEIGMAEEGSKLKELMSNYLGTKAALAEFIENLT